MMWTDGTLVWHAHPYVDGGPWYDDVLILQGEDPPPIYAEGTTTSTTMWTDDCCVVLGVVHGVIDDYKITIHDVHCLLIPSCCTTGRLMSFVQVRVPPDAYVGQEEEDGIEEAAGAGLRSKHDEHIMALVHLFLCARDSRSYY